MRQIPDRQYFEDFKTRLFSQLQTGEHAFLNLYAEESQFLRINGAKVRQIGTVKDSIIEMTLITEKRNDSGIELRKGVMGFTLTGLSYEDQERSQEALRRLREEVPQLPPDPYAVLPQNPGSSVADTKGELLPISSASEGVLEPLASIDAAGIYASGPVVRAMANSAGLTHWFSTELFSFDYSLYTSGQRAVKGTFAGTRWDRGAYLRDIEASRQKLALLEKPGKQVPRGSYRTYLEPAAVGELINMFSWGLMSEASVRQGDSALQQVRRGEAGFSPLFSLTEDFTRGAVPRFNTEGELAPEMLPLIKGGKLVNTLVSSRSTKEYGVASNGASRGETMRAPSVSTGTLRQNDVLAELGTGLYLSNLHYLNWSDQPKGRITGMTRYACFWVENGKIAAPIENLRFDDSVFHLFGKNLVNLTESPSFLAETGSYFTRQLGGVRTPGMLVSGMEFTI